MPAIYIQSVLGSRNDYKGVEKQERIENQSAKILLADIEKELQTDPLRTAVYGELTQMLSIRKEKPSIRIV